MGFVLAKDAEHLASAISSDMKAYYAALICRMPKNAIISVSTDGSCDVVIQQPEPDVSAAQNAVTDLRSLRDALVARMAH